MSEPTPAPTIHAPATSNPTPLVWVKTQLFSTPANALLTILSVWLLIMAVPALLDWVFLQAKYSAQSGQECREVEGACWAFIAEKHRLILFGTYPYEQQWRPLVSIFLLVALVLLSAWRKLWNIWLFPIWIVGLSVVALLMWGGRVGADLCGKHAVGRFAADAYFGNLLCGFGLSARGGVGLGSTL